MFNHRGETEEWMYVLCVRKELMPHKEASLLLFHFSLHPPVYAKDHTAGELLGRKGAGGSGGHQVENDPAVYPSLEDG